MFQNEISHCFLFFTNFIDTTLICCCCCCCYFGKDWFNPQPKKHIMLQEHMLIIFVYREQGPPVLLTALKMLLVIESGE